MAVYRIRSWKEYGNLAREFKPEIIYYAHEKEIPILVEDIKSFLHTLIGKVKVSPIWFVS